MPETMTASDDPRERIPARGGSGYTGAPERTARSRTLDATSIELIGSRITAVRVDGDEVRVRFEPAYLIETMSGSVEKTRWRQNGEIVFGGARLLADPPTLPADCAGGDVGENIYTYRDMIPLPLESRGRAFCRLRVEGSERLIEVEGERIELVMEETPRYIEHIRPEDLPE